MPPPPGAGGVPPAGVQPPPGYVAYGTPVQMRAALQSTRGLRIATVILIWIATGGTGLQLLTITNRRAVWNDPTSSFSDLVNADDAVVGSFVLYFIAVVATVILLSIWTLRAVRNSQSLGTVDLNPGLACGGWYIPFGNVFVPFIQLRRATRGLGARTTASTVWQVGWGAMVVAGLVVNTAFSNADVFDPDAVSRDLDTQVTGAWLVFIAAIVAASAATIAIKALDDAVTARTDG